MVSTFKESSKALKAKFGWSDLVIFVVVTVLLGTMSRIEKPEKTFSLLDTLISTSSVLIPIYINHFLLVPRFFDKGHFTRYVIVFVVFWGIVTTLSALSLDAHDYEKYGTIWQFIPLLAIGQLMILLVGLTMLFTKRAILQTQVKLKNKVLIQQMEMKLLKAQLNPHFLFNSLNNIYALSLDSLPETSDTILKLSELMRYQLQSSQKQTLPLADELQFVQNYIDLERIRLTEKSDVQLHIEGEVAHQQIAPMLLIPFIENSFKHGINTIQDNFIHIFIHVQHHHLSFDIKNSIPSKNAKRISTKTGLDNTQRRLNLLYKNQYDLNITAENNTFKVHLELELT
ncbi:sensor histidine kinase [Microscilla marina]|uniref:Signaling protein without kinase domain n=1 Tax=Microscilla marina ATCC 23134 TaxID=313606 RepID=A1ZFR3_MICM2|nr:histidine kinase [Microscilla marina]EAY30837.1 signaling protein without kinase domain [Microscilla marina ATCC 23134]